jgi:predicted anti-sigma-YlaC factor YlaD
MLDDAIKIMGRLQLELRGADGLLKQQADVDNLVVTVGKGVIADRMKAVPTLGAMSHVAVGTGAVAPVVGDTTLGAEVAGSRTAFTNTAVAAAVITYTAALGPGVGTGALTEAGLFNAAAAGQMLARTTFTTINKAAGDTLNVTWTVTIG